MIVIENSRVFSDNDSYICRRSKPDIVFQKGLARPNESADDFDEVDEPPLPYTKKQYSAEVERLIARRYSSGQEIQLLVERDSDPDAYADYRAYVEQCKLTAARNLTAAAESEEAELQL